MHPESATVEAGGIHVDDNAINDVLSWLQSAGSPYFACPVETVSGKGEDAAEACGDPGLLCHQMTQRFFNNA